MDAIDPAGPDPLLRASSLHAIAALQGEHFLWGRDVEDEVLATCRELGIGYLA